ncbi:hypothetical protein NL108_010045 [Boleophthalmus pectinirostris]|nr:hypothetical protein NL108_010045 [Boleophthalmus pectinirostris]
MGSCILSQGQSKVRFESTQCHTYARTGSACAYIRGGGERGPAGEPGYSSEVAADIQTDRGHRKISPESQSTSKQTVRSCRYRTLTHTHTHTHYTHTHKHTYTHTTHTSYTQTHTHT